MAIPTSDGFKTARNNEDFSKSKVQVLLPNFSMANKYGCVATASSAKTGYEAIYSNDGKKTHLDKWWESVGSFPESANLKGAWFLDESSGLTAADSSGNGNDGTLTNMAGTEWTPFVINNGIEFIDSIDYIDVGNDNTLRPQDLTLMMWVNLDDISWNRGGLYCNYNGVNGFYFGIGVECVGGVITVFDPGELFFRTANGGVVYDFSSTSEISVSTTTHIAVTYNSTTKTCKFYINGANVSTEVGTQALAYGVDNARIGDGVGINFSLDGKIDEVYFWDKVLTDAQILEVKNLTMHPVGLPAILTHALLPEANIEVEYDENADWDLGVFVDTLDTESVDSVTLNGLYDYYFLPDSANCKLFLKMDSDGDEIDYSGNGNHAIMSGTVPQQASGIVGAAREAFSGNNYFSIIDNATIRASDNFSISFWIKGSFIGGNEAIIFKGTTSGVSTNAELDYLFIYDSVGGEATHLRFSISDGIAQYSVYTTTAVNTNTWFHIVGTYDHIAQELKIYVNNVCEDTTVVNIEINSYIKELRIGKAYDIYAQYFSGIIDELMFYQSTLTAGNVATLYAAGAPYRRLASGTWESPEINLGFIPSGGIGTLVWEESKPPNTNITMQIDYSDDGVVWDGYIAITNGGTLDTRQYVQFKATLTTSDQLFSPALSKLTIKWKPLTRRISQVIVYGYTGNNYISECNLKYWNGNAWTAITPTKVWGFSRNQTSNPAVTNVAEVITSAAEQIFIRFTEVETNKIRLCITDTSDNNAAKVAEMEVYRIIEPTSSLLNDYISSRISRRQDFSNRWYQGATWSMVFDNHHRKYSSVYKPTATETATDNFFNDYLNDGIIKIWKWGGYEVSGADELVQQLDGIVDTMSTDPGSPQRATFEGRDKYYMLTQKPININESDIGTKSIENYIEYILNLCNIPSSEISLPSYGITLPLTILCNANAVDKLKLLVEATGNGALYCSKQGRWESNFINKNRKWIETNTADFKAGAHTNTSYFDEEGTILLNIQNGNLPNNNSFETYNDYSWISVSPAPSGFGTANPWNWGAPQGNPPLPPYPNGTHCGTTVKSTPSIFFAFEDRIGTFSNPTDYGVRMDYREEGGGWVYLDQWNIFPQWTNCVKDMTALRNKKIQIRFRAWRRITNTSPDVNDGLYTNEYFYCSGGILSFYTYLNYVISWITPIIWRGNFFYDYVVGGRRSYINGSFISQSHDCTQGIASETINKFTTMKATINVPANTTMTVKIQYSTDNVNWGVNSPAFNDTLYTEVFAQATAFAGDKVANIADPGDESAIRYVRYQVVMTTADDNYTPRLYEMRINWRTGAASSVSNVPAFTFGYQGASSGDGLLKSMKASYSSLISNQAKICTQTVCKVNRLFLSASAEKVWDGMTGDSPLNIAVNTTLYAELECPCKKDVNMRLQISDGISTKNYYGDGTSGGALPANLVSVTVTWGNQRIKIVMVVSGGGPNLTIFEIQALTYKPKGKTEILSQAKNYAELFEMFGEKQIAIDNEFIMSHTVAKDMADGTIDLYAKGRIRIEGVRVAFSPDAELYDCAAIKELNSGIDRNLWISEITDTDGGDGRSKTELTLEEI
jgi:hypothetical protein